MKRSLLCVFAGVVGLGLLLTGCKDDSAGTATSAGGQQAPQAAAGDPLPDALVLSQAPEKATDVRSLRQAKPGDAVVVRGRVGGRVEPIVAGRAAFQVFDKSLKACNEGSAMEECKTPWDLCCDDAKDVAARSATIQVVGADGKPLRANLKGVGGLKELSEVTVKGTVAQAGESGPVVVNATGIYVGGK